MRGPQMCAWRGCDGCAWLTESGPRDLSRRLTCVHVVNGIDAVDHHLGALGRAQGQVAHRAVLRDVQVLAGSQGRDLPLDVSRLCQAPEQRHGHRGHALAAEVEGNAIVLHHERVTPLSILHTNKKKCRAA